MSISSDTSLTQITEDIFETLRSSRTSRLPDDNLPLQEVSSFTISKNNYNYDYAPPEDNASNHSIQTTRSRISKFGHECSQILHQKILSIKNYSAINHELYNSEEMPERFQIPHISNFYQPPTKSSRKCFKQIFKLHNQTGNIWTHLLPSLIFLYSILQHQAVSNYYYTNPSLDKMILTFYKTTVFLCFTGSWIYHSHWCHENLQGTCRIVDINGIIVMYSGSSIVWVYYVFYCSKYWQLFYIIAMFVLCSAVVIQNSFGLLKNHRLASCFLIVALCFSIFIPLIHLLVMHDNFQFIWNKARYSYLVWSFCFYIGSVVFYCTRFPERCFPGVFDLFFHSHQIFHVGVVFGCYFHLLGVMKLQEDLYKEGMFCKY